MKIIIEGMLISTYVKPDFKDKDSGEVTKGKPVLQLLVDTELSNGSIKQEMQWNDPTYIDRNLFS